jgi:hypothetical protein
VVRRSVSSSAYRSGLAEARGAIRRNRLFDGVDHSNEPLPGDSCGFVDCRRRARTTSISASRTRQRTCRAEARDVQCIDARSN